MKGFVTFLSLKVSIVGKNKPNYREFADLAGISKVKFKNILFGYLNKFLLFLYKHFAVISQNKLYQ